jgi:hypothetical protein
VQVALNGETQRSVLQRFGIKGVSLDNIEQVYNPLISGISSMHATRTFLISKGMTNELADNLARRYINKLESSGQIFSIMDFFNTASNATALNTLIKSNMSDVNFAYQTWDEYKQGLADKSVYGSL